MTPMTSEQMTQTIEDAIAFTRAADAAGVSESQARKLAAEIGAMPADQRERICRFAFEQRRAMDARLARKKRAPYARAR